ncbi:MAG: hypothetical protein R3336_00575, partial [Phycisphaeraceae bacterium]|nr:hypothetical protein [Phycisphaeraceae bacterium]
MPNEHPPLRGLALMLLALLVGLTAAPPLEAGPADYELGVWREELTKVISVDVVKQPVEAVLREVCKKAGL